MREKYEAMGNEMTRSLGFENKKVILFWKAFEEERWLACELHYNCFKKGLTKQSTLGIIIIESEREVNNMEELARKYERKHAGHVTKITNYSFEFETVPNKDGKVEKYVVMLSYFLKL